MGLALLAGTPNSPTISAFAMVLAELAVKGTTGAISTRETATLTTNPDSTWSLMNDSLLFGYDPKSLVILLLFLCNTYAWWKFMRQGWVVERLEITIAVLLIVARNPGTTLSQLTNKVKGLPKDKHPIFASVIKLLIIQEHLKPLPNGVLAIGSPMQDFNEEKEKQDGTKNQ